MSSLSKKVSALLVAASVMMSISACGGNSTSSPSTSVASETAISSASTEKQNQEITLKCLIENGDATWNDEFNASPVGQEIKKQTGITLEIVACDTNKYNVVLASGDLPDIIRAKTGDFKKLIEGENVIALDDLLQSNGKNLMQTIPDTINFSKKYWSNNTNKLYFIPPQVGTESMGQELAVGPVIRWDYYKELGCPKIDNQDDLLNVVSLMVKKHPKTDDGKTVTGIAFWSDWGVWPYMFATAPMNGYYSLGTSLTPAIKADTNELTDMATDMNAPFWKSVDFFYKANKLGILDKDSFTMKFSDYSAKCTSGQELYGYVSWGMGDFNKNNAKDGKGFMAIPLDWGFQWSGSSHKEGWADKAMAITKKATNPERAMDLFNYLWSYDGVRTLNSGVKGTDWDIVDGKAKLKDETLKLKAENGDDWLRKNKGIKYDENWFGLSGVTVNPADGTTLNLFEDTEVYQATLTPLQKDFSSFYGVKYPAEIFKKKVEEGKNKNFSTVNTLAAAVIPTAPDDIKRIEAKLTDLIQKNFAKCILSKSDTEFEANKTKAIEDFKAAGSQKYFDWYLKAWNAAKAAQK